MSERLALVHRTRRRLLYTRVEGGVGVGEVIRVHLRSAEDQPRLVALHHLGIGVIDVLRIVQQFGIFDDAGE